MLRWSGQSGKPPPSMLGDDFILRPRHPLQRNPELLPPGIPHRHRYIPEKTPVLRPHDRRPAKDPPKLRLVDLREPFERRCDQIAALRLCPRRLTIPRTDILANIAPEKMIPDPVPLSLRNRPPQLNREIRNTTPRIEFKTPVRRRNNGIGRASVDTSSASPTSVGRR